MTDIISDQSEINSILPMIMVFVPLLGSLGILVCGTLSERIRNLYVVIITAVPLAMLVGMFPVIRQGTLEYRIDWFLEIGLIFRIDAFSYLFVVLISLIWFLATLYAIEYISHEHNRNRFYFFWLVTYAATLGVFVTGDLFGLFLFFELMSLASYVLVIHEEDIDAMRAGNLYLFLGVGGGLSILFGLFILYFNLDTLEITPMLGEIVASGVNIPVIILLFLLGFGIKAGIVPLHIWLPKAHPVAPTPASAVLSGLLIKTGVYGIWRVFMVVLAPADGQNMDLFLENIAIWGMVLFWIGIITLFLGALMAFLQTSAKKMLAYSSVSQIGFIILGLGAAIALGPEGPIGFAGGLMHVVNHALFKACLFLIVGAIFIRTHLLDIDRVRGMFKQMPYMGVAFIIAALGIAGVPFFNGYSSKTIIGHALADVAYMNPGITMEVADYIFLLTSALTVSYFVKLFRRLFLGQLPEEWRNTDFSVAPVIKAVITVFAVLIIGIGVFPNFVLEQIIVPTMGASPFGQEVITSQLMDLNFYTAYDLTKVVRVFAIAGIITVADIKFQVSRVTPPWWLSIEALVYKNAITKIMFIVEKLGTAFDVSVQDFYETTGKTSVKICRKISELDEGINQAYTNSGETAKNLSYKTSSLDQQLNSFYDKTGKTATSSTVLRPVSDYDEKGNEILEKVMERAYNDENKTRQFRANETSKVIKFMRKLKLDPANFTVKNLNFDSFIIAIVLGLSLLFLVFNQQLF